MSFRFVQTYSNNDTKDNWELWEPFRDMNRDQVYKVVFNRNKLKYDRALILGAGNGNDIDVRYLEDTFKEITLVDIDETALDRFIEKAKSPNKFIKKIIDLSGIEKIMTLDIANKTLPQIETTLRKATPSHDFSELSGQYDFILNSNYTSQLVNPFILSILAAIGKTPTSKIISELSELSVRIITSLFNNIHNLLDKDGVFIHSIDTFEVSEDEETGYKSPAYYPVMEALNGSMANIQNLYRQDILSGLRKYMIVGNYIPNIDRKFKVESMRFVPWRFKLSKTEVRYYICSVYAFNKV